MRAVGALGPSETSAARQEGHDTSSDADGPARSAVEVTIGICTYRRPWLLARLLDRLEALEFRRVPRPELRVLVVDNSPDAEGRSVTESGGRTLPWQYVHHGAGNIASARNRVLDEAQGAGRWLALIDDDEWPEPTWLDELLAAQGRTGAPLVCGPVLPDYPVTAPTWLRRDAFYAVSGHQDLAELDEGITGNALVDLTAVDRLGLRFDEAFGLSGGEDQQFFRSARAGGLRIVWAACAVAREAVDPQRLSAQYLVRREFRKGNTLGLLDRPSGGSEGPRPRPVRRSAAAVKWLALGLLQLVTAGARSEQGDALAGILRIARGAGMVTGLAGARYRLYGRIAQQPGGRGVVAIVVTEAPGNQAAGHTQYLAGLVTHARSLGLQVVMLVTTGRLGFGIRRTGADGVSYVSRDLSRVAGYDVLKPLPLVKHGLWRAFQVAPHRAQRVADAVRRRLRARRSVDFSLGSFPDPDTSDWITLALQRLRPDVLLFNTVFTVPQPVAPAVEAPFTAIVTHDVMSDRADMFRSLGYRISPEGFSAPLEADVLRQVPHLIALQWDDAARLRELAPSADVLVVPVTASPPAAVTRQPRPGRCLFVGSGSLHNVDGLTWFLEECWPEIRRQHPGAELHVVGTVCARVSSEQDGVVLRGEIPDLAAEYAQAALSVVPLRVGSGLKVKIVEAICHHVPTVTTSVGAQGLLALEPRPFVRADTAAEFIDAVSALLADAGLRTELGSAAAASAGMFHPDRAFQELDDELEARGVDVGRRRLP